MHFVIALVLLWAGLLLVGTTNTSLTLTQVSCAKGTVADTCSPSTPAPAKAAGIQPGDTLVSYDGKALKSWDAFITAVQDGGTKPATVVYKRDGVVHTTTVTPVTVKDSSGQTLLIDPAKDPRPAPKIGVSSVRTTHYNALSAVPQAFATFGTGVSDTVTGLGKLPSQIAHAFDKGRTAANSPASRGRRRRDRR